MMSKNTLLEPLLEKLDNDRPLVSIVGLVTDIPWGEGRSVEEVLVSKNVGTCTGKHLVLQACLGELEIEYIPVVCTFRWSNQTINYPENLRSILNEGEWEHGHNFVQVDIDGEYVDVDITWNSKLKPYGFKTLPKDWDGISSYVGVDNIIQRWDGAGITNKKNELSGSLDAEMRGRRARFLKEFIRWVDSINR